MTNTTVNRKNSTKWNLFFLYLRVAIGIINGILIVPLYLHFIKTDLYGAWLATGNILVWITLVDPGVGEVLTQKVSMLLSQHKYATMKLMFSSAILISFIVTLLALLGSFIVSFFIPEVLRVKDTLNTHELVGAFRIMALGTACTLFSYSFAGILLGFQLVKIQGIVQIIAGLLGIVINVVLLFAGFGLYSIAIQYFFKGVFVLSCYFVYFLLILKKQKIRLKFNKKYFFQFSKVFSYTWLAKIANVFSDNLDLIIVSRYIGSEFVTILEMTRRPLNTLQGILNTPSVAILPAASHLYGEGNAEKLKEIVFRFLRISFYLVFIVSFGFITFNNALVNLWVGGRYFLGFYQNILICLIFLLNAIIFNLMMFSFSFGNIKGNSLFTMIKSIFYISLLYFASKFFGITGILILSLITATFGFFYYPKVLRKILKVENQEIKGLIKSIILLLITGIVLAVLFGFFYIKTWWLLMIATSCFILLYLITLWVFDQKFRFEIKGLLSKTLFRNWENRA